MSWPYVSVRLYGIAMHVYAIACVVVAYIVYYDIGIHVGDGVLAVVFL